MGVRVAPGANGFQGWEWDQGVEDSVSQYIDPPAEQVRFYSQRLRLWMRRLECRKFRFVTIKLTKAQVMEMREQGYMWHWLPAERKAVFGGIPVRITDYDGDVGLLL